MGICTLDRTTRAAAVDEPFHHDPVLLTEVVDLFAPVVGGTIIDATLGGGGHAEALLAADRTRKVIGVDRDESALAAATRRLARFGDRFTTRRGRFDTVLGGLTAEADPTSGTVTGVLFDLGVSSPQLDRPERGFSYHGEAPLDMRMDRDAVLDADEVVNRYPVGELARILSEYGDERFARRVAEAIVAARPVTTTTRLAEIVRDAIPAATRRTGGHPAKRTFQAIRIEVNGELAALRSALTSAVSLVRPGGRVAVISYHSGEDRIVKHTFRDAADGGCTCPVGLPCRCGAVATGRVLTRGGITPGDPERARNPRSTSARLRALEVLP